jgi:voltage-gated potassium channel
MADPRTEARTTREWLLTALEGSAREPVRRVFMAFVAILVVLNLVAMMLATVDGVGPGWSTVFDLLYAFSIALFTLEYLVRFWVVGADADRGDATAARFAYMRSPGGVIDLLAILPFYVDLFVWGDPFAFSIGRVLLIGKLGRVIPALGTVGTILVSERRALFGAAVAIGSFLTLSATILYALERHTAPDVFSDLPTSLLWVIRAATTLGEGGTEPATGLGQALAGVITLLSIWMYAMPIGIIAAAFAQEIHRRDFIVTWGMVAEVPLFAGLDAGAIARIASLLRARIVPAGHTVVHRGGVGDSMYFISSGAVEVVSPGGGEAVHLHEGEFFGEVALLQHTPRTASVVALTRCRLLVLEAADFRRMMTHEPEVRAKIDAIMRGRLTKRDPAG